MKIFYLIIFSILAYTHLSAIWVVNQSSITLYEQPKEFSKIEDIAAYSTVVEIEKELKGWVFLNVPKTGWHGWAQKKDLIEVEVDPETAANAHAGYKGAFLYPFEETIFGYLYEIPFMTPLQTSEEGVNNSNRWVKVKLLNEEVAFAQKEQLDFKSKVFSKEEMIEFSKLFLGKKYIFGGTTSLGFDGSGFIQMLFQQCGISLPRNACDQFLDRSFKEVPSSQAQAGDLIFFKNEKGVVRQVGLMIDQQKFIQSFPRDQSCIMISDINEPRWVNGDYSFSIVIKRLK